MTSTPSRCDADIARLLDRGLPEGRVVRIGQYEGAWTAADVARVVATRQPAPRPSPEPEPEPEPDGPRQVVLSPRIAQVLDGLRQGLTAAQIADGLGLTTNTVKTHLGRLYARLGARGRVHAVALAHSDDLALVVEEPGGRRRPWIPAPLPDDTPQPPGSSWLTAAEVADELRISKMTVYRLATAGHMRHIRVGRTVRIERQWLDEWIAAQVGP